MNRKIVITGASGEIGSATALRFSEEKAELFLIGGKNTEELLKTEGKCIENGSSVISRALNLALREERTKVSEEILKTFGAPDVLVFASGISIRKQFQDITPAEYEELFHTNVTAVVELTRALLPSMIAKKCGRIVNVSSVYGNTGGSMEVDYSLTKGAINAYTKALAKELAPSHIMVNAVSPGFIDTKMNGFLTKEEKEMLADEIPMQRAGTKEEVAELIYQLSCAPEYLTGQILTLDGGWT